MVSSLLCPSHDGPQLAELLASRYTTALNNGDDDGGGRGGEGGGQRAAGQIYMQAQTVSEPHCTADRAHEHPSSAGAAGRTGTFPSTHVVRSLIKNGKAVRCDFAILRTVRYAIPIPRIRAWDQERGRWPLQVTKLTTKYDEGALKGLTMVSDDAIAQQPRKLALCAAGCTEAARTLFQAV